MTSQIPAPRDLMSFYPELHEPQGPFGCFEAESVCPDRENPRFLGRPCRSLFTLMTELHSEIDAFRLHNQHQQTFRRNSRMILHPDSSSTDGYSFFLPSAARRLLTFQQGQKIVFACPKGVYEKAQFHTGEKLHLFRDCKNK